MNPDVALAEALLSPPLAPWEPCRDALVGTREPREAWERLAARDLLPMSWVDHPTRRFGRGTPLGAKSAGALAEPWSAVSAALFACDHTAMLKVEALWTEARSRWDALGFALPTELSWKLTAAPKVSPTTALRMVGESDRYRLRSCLLIVPEMLARPLRSFENGQHLGDREVSTAKAAEELDAWCARWRDAVGQEKSPSEPVRAIWASGHSVGHFAREVDLALGVPEPRRRGLELAFGTYDPKARRCQGCGHDGANAWCQAEGLLCGFCTVEHGYWNSCTYCAYCDDVVEWV